MEIIRIRIDSPFRMLFCNRLGSIPQGEMKPLLQQANRKLKGLRWLVHRLKTPISFNGCLQCYYIRANVRA